MPNKFRLAIDVLQRGRDTLVDALADDVLDQADDLVDGGFAFNEFLEAQGTRLHFLCLLLAQLEQSADAHDLEHAPPPVDPPPSRPRKPRTRSRKAHRPAAPEGSTDEA
jgi:hypothetical protein